MSRWIGVAAIVAFGSVACGGSTSQSPSAPSGTGTVVVASATVSLGGGESAAVGDAVEIEGRIESLPPTQPANTLLIDGRKVTIGDDTIIREGETTRTFADLAVGERVHVKGALGADTIAATTITIQNTNTSIPVNVNGTVETLTGTAADFAAIIDGREVRADSTTTFYGDGDAALTFAALQVGSRVEVKGLQQDGFVFAVRIHINGATTTTGTPQDESASVEGRLTAMTGTAPALTLTIGGTTVTTTSATSVQRRGDVQTFAALAIGQTIHVVGTRMADKSIVARLLQVKDDETGGYFVISGSMGGVKGTCPSLTFSVDGYSIYTTAGTAFGLAPVVCTDFKSGTKVDVTGTTQADGSVQASAVTRR